jgi:chemotaxis-related protein WspD
VLLDRPAPADYVREWTARLAAEDQAAEAGTETALIFRVGTEWLCLPVPVFEEIAEPLPVHRVPHRRDGVLLGLVNVRGELLPCVSLGALLQLDQPEAAVASSAGQWRGRLLVANRQRSRLAFPVDEVHGVYRYQPRELQPVPTTLEWAAGVYTRHMLLWHGRAVASLDDELLFHALNGSLA